MIYKIKFNNVRPFSINKAHYRNGVRTRENREWAHEVHKQIANCPQFINFKKQALKASFFHVLLCFNIPQSKFYTKKGKISRLTSDLTNVEKGLVDVIFDKRFQGRVQDDVKYVTLECDDTLITKLISEKRADASEEYSVDCTLQAFN